jgi:predicted Zn-dependent protease
MVCRILKKAWTILLIVFAGYAGSYAAWYWLDHSASLCYVSLVPLGDFQESALRDLAGHYEKRLGVRVDFQPAIPIEESAIDFKRRQLIGEELIDLMKRRLPQLADDPSVMIMGITNGDMYTRHKNWRFAFAVREAGRFAVVSTARMDPVNFGLPSDQAVLSGRLTKMATKQLGLQYYGLRERKEKTSVLFSPILGLDDLDEVSGEFDEVDRHLISKVVKSCKT